MITNFLRTLSIIFLVINAIGALAGGFALIIEPDGSKLGIPASILKNSPFDDFLIPGILLLLLNGVFSTVVLFALTMRSRWAEKGIIIQGIVLYLWIAAQVVLLGFTKKIHIIFGFIAVVLIICGYLLRRKKLQDERRRAVE
ncbi:hypothetical protein [Gynurincola endophyticus]|uniref:hypothetical protein n=1 Tax=Gynurincola endophyticus TaxID=2479004 RepID=UPI000F8F7302|nr:hypothetical protein [Gynurincola endophyticus]